MTPGRASDHVAKAGEVRRHRARSQLLDRPGGRSAPAIVAHLLAVAAQDARSARLAIRARSRPGLLATEVDGHLSAEPELVVGWLCRGTLHMVCVEDYGWLLGLTAAAGDAQSRRRLAEEGLTPAEVERGVRTIEHALTTDGPLTRQELAGRIRRASLPAVGQAVVHLIMLSAVRGIAVPAATRAERDRLALTDDWLGGRPTGDLRGEAREAALGELARRYLKGHAPASDRDLARWSGLGLREIRRGLSRIADELVNLTGDLIGLRVGLPSLEDERTAPTGAALAPVLLPSFDPYMLGWADRGFAVPAVHAKRVHPGGGMLRAVACVDGMAIGTWTARRRKAGLTVSVEPFDRLGEDAARGLAADGDDVVRFEGRGPA